MIIAPDKAYFCFQPKTYCTFFLFFHGSICCGYSLEVPQRGTSNEYPQHTFSWRNEKKNISQYSLYRGLWQDKVIIEGIMLMFVCIEVLWPSQPNVFMLSVVSFT